MYRNVQSSLVLAVVIVSLLAIAVFVVHRHSGWPIPESPPHQGEALDGEAYKQDRYVYAHSALLQAVREPFNAWSNVLFIFLGGLFFSVRSVIRVQTGSAMIAVGIGSFLYHASSSRFFRNFDVGAMYWLYLMLIALAVGVVSRRFRRFFTRTTRVWLFVMPVIAALITVYRNTRLWDWKPFDLSFATGIAVTSTVIGLVLASRRLGGWLFSYCLIVLLLAGILCQVGDRPGGWLCHPQGMVQAHGVWHIFAAIACWMACTLLIRVWENTPNQSLEPTPKSVTDRAAHAPRQPWAWLSIKR